MQSTESNFLYQNPILGVDPSDCFFYHCMDIPEVGEVGTQWDIRDVAEQYLGETNFKGKRVLDVGAASGFLSFEMEKRGAEVVSFDMSDSANWNLVPHYSIDNWDKKLASIRDWNRKLKNAYWFTHEKLNSKAKVFYGDVYDLPLELGEFDIVFFGMILGHLQNPFQALFSGSRLCRDSMMVTNQTVTHRQLGIKREWGKNVAAMRFMPSPENGIFDSWWEISNGCLSQMLDVLGFETRARFNSQPKCVVPGRIGVEPCTTTVTKRVATSASEVAKRSTQPENVA